MDCIPLAYATPIQIIHDLLTSCNSYKIFVQEEERRQTNKTNIVDGTTNLINPNLRSSLIILLQPLVFEIGPPDSKTCPLTICWNVLLF